MEFIYPVCISTAENSLLNVGGMSKFVLEVEVENAYNCFKQLLGSYKVTSQEGVVPMICKVPKLVYLPLNIRIREYRSDKNI